MPVVGASDDPWFLVHKIVFTGGLPALLGGGPLAPRAPPAQTMRGSASQALLVRKPRILVLECHQLESTS